MRKERKGISVIIPAHNESFYLPKTIESLLSQKEIGDLELIVPISPNTTDNTYLIAKEKGCKIVKGGKPATSRNNGANVVSYDILFFLDADTYPNENKFLSKALKEFSDRKLDLAGTLLSPDYRGNKFKSLLYRKVYDVENHFFKKRENSKKPKQQSGMFIRKDVFFKLNGFKEGIFGEDSDITERAVNKNYNFNFGILKKCGPLKNSVRRFEKEGFFRTLLKVGYFNLKAELFGYKSLKGTIGSYLGNNTKNKR